MGTNPSLSKGISTAQNLLMSKDVLAIIQAVKKLGVKVVLIIKLVKFLSWHQWI